MDWPGWRAMFARDDGVETFEPLPRDFVDGVEAPPRIVLPPALRTLYRATDGVFDKLGQWFVN